MTGNFSSKPEAGSPFHALLHALVLAVIAVFGGGVLIIAAPPPAHAEPAEPVYYREGGILVESYADCVRYECPPSFSLPVMVDMPGTIGDLLSIPRDRSGTGPTLDWTITYTIVDARVAGVGAVTVTGRAFRPDDPIPIISERIWPFVFTDEMWPYTDECGTADDTFFVPADVSWTAPTPTLVPGPPSSLSIVYTVFDGRVDGEGMVIIRALIITEVGSGPVGSLQNHAYELTNEACAPPVTPPPVEPTQPPVSPPPPTTTTVTPPPTIPATGAHIAAAAIIGSLGVLGGAIALGIRRLRGDS